MTRLPKTRPRLTRGPRELEWQKLVLLDGLQDASPTSAIAVHGRDANEKENDLCRQMLRSTDTYLLQEAR